jgi:hypothetical protein
MGRIDIQSFRIKENDKKIRWTKKKGIREHSELAFFIQ